ncbi:acid-sensing ion channel 1-like [Amphibalanus amphitrite]|uniref:acid-sensing ion channel 1-like n=1 Tax=Amphibalanus amphitrite TaxID=1232801 RepID=UPI001C90140C|nr:acid-sensing ion channel 1-like [Amphibalanus amphitrite]
MPCGCSWNGRRWVAGAEASLGLSGLPVVTSGGAHWLRRLLWALILVVSFVWLVVQLHGSVIRLMYQNVGTESRYELMQSMPFPAITICAAHRFKKEQWLNMSLDGVTAEQLGALKGEDKFRFLRWDELNFDEFYDSASYSYDDLVESCRFHGQSCAVLSTLSTAFTNKYGACHTITLTTNANGTWTQPQLEMRLTLPDPADPEMRETSPGWYVILHDSETGFSDLSAFAPASYNVLSVRKGQDTTAKMRRQETFYLSLTGGGCSDEVGAVDHAQCLKACLDGRLKPSAAQNSSETTPQQTNRQNSTG